ncbi:MAG: hypothetical protein LGR52_03370 [Candidatus Thiosymbion ectosymbiont of Robbea hypermnestra]|nr:hypothetical protein [Candidatus Thiosymbion ectosymbiont of Robbea hypermnestra]
MVGIEGLLNLGQPLHTTVVVTDFDDSDRVVATFRRALGRMPTKLVHLDLSGAGKDGGETKAGDWAIDPAAHGLNQDKVYLSVLALLCRHGSLKAVRQLQETIPRGDCARLELPSVEMGFELSHAMKMADVILSADYGVQDLASDTFFERLALNAPYRVEISTPNGMLLVSGSRPWFQLAGRLVDGESRILPGGEVAYTGSDIEGVFTVTGGLLATPEAPEAAPLARALTRLSRRFEHDPVTMTIADGQVMAFESKGPLAGTLDMLLRGAGYRQVTEVGISFNTACRTLIHDWPASSNEGCPGVHLGLGGDPDPEQEPAKESLVHIDLISPTVLVLVNGKPFMKLA